MSVYALILALMVYRKLPETLVPAHRAPLEFGVLVGNLFRVARHAEFLLLTAASGLCFVVLQIYIGSAPAIILDHWGGTEVGFAMLTVPIITGYAIGAVASGRMAGRLRPERQAGLGYSLLVLATGAMLLMEQFVRAPPVLAQQLLLGAMAFAMQLLFPIVTLRILDLFARSRGAATAAHTFVLLVAAAFAMGTMAPWLSQSMRRLAITAFVFSLSGWCVWRLARWYQKRFPVQLA
jgi:DHA1 family bicyclomycin/chloramphenicol resistance-like MFS transporter